MGIAALVGDAVAWLRSFVDGDERRLFFMLLSTLIYAMVVTLAIVVTTWRMRS